MHTTRYAVLAGLPLLVFVFAGVSVSAQVKAGVPIDPSRFLQKTFEECEKVLGKPARVVNPKGQSRSYIRYYKTRIPSITRIIVERAPDGSMDGPVPKTVNILSYHFPSDKVSTPQEALSVIGIKKDNAKLDDESTDEFPLGKFTAQWITGDSTRTMPVQYRHVSDNELRITRAR